jgi:CRP/FNR family transcriptional regulator, cyclic AMP receptor protein
MSRPPLLCEQGNVSEIQTETLPTLRIRAFVPQSRYNLPPEQDAHMPASKTRTESKSINTDSVADFLSKITAGKTLLTLRKGCKIFSQGAKADAIYFIQNGHVKISVISPSGKEASLALLGPRDFFGEGCLVGQSLRINSATTLGRSVVFRVEKRAMLRGFHTQLALSEKFLAAVLVRNIALEEDLCDQLFNHSERRLARVLLKLARLREHNTAIDAQMPKLSHESLAEMVGTTRPRITEFMNKFRKMGLIDYNGVLTIRTELLTDILLRD